MYERLLNDDDKGYKHDTGAGQVGGQSVINTSRVAAGELKPLRDFIASTNVDRSLYADEATDAAVAMVRHRTARR